jgi:hypothetical protein
VESGLSTRGVWAAGGTQGWAAISKPGDCRRPPRKGVKAGER